ncbi:MAG: cysteine desulfurase [Acidimicrobiales bacterium]|nr:cysteine desulfurase [Acidimicrobiales bacterium]
MSRSYLDHASTSVLRPQARDALVEALVALGGDPGRIHEEGMAARVALERAREQVAGLLGARSREVVFTSGATESIAAAVWGATARTRGRAGQREGHDATDGTVHHVVTAVEHSAVRHSSERAGDVTIVPVDGGGRVDADAVLASIGPNTAAVHVQWGNHEVGTIQPVVDVVAGCRERGVLVHVDAAQAAGRVPIAFTELGADLLSLSGHKLGGPAGTGALLVRRGLRLPPLLLGGDQERARRAGLEPVAQLVAFGAACAALTEPVDDASSVTRLDAEMAESVRLTDRIRSVLRGIEGVTEYGDPQHRLPHLVCVGVEGVEPQGVLLGLDRAGVAAHSGSACSSESLEPSPVLDAMGVDAHHSLRLSVGWNTTDADVDRLAAALPEVVDGLRALAR